MCTQPDYGGFTRLGKKRTTEMVNAGPPPQAHVAAEPFPPSQPSPDTFSGGAQQASEPGASCLGAGAYLSEALAQAEDQLRGLDLHPVHPPVGSGMRTHKAQVRVVCAYENCSNIAASQAPQRKGSTAIENELVAHCKTALALLIVVNIAIVF